MNQQIGVKIIGLSNYFTPTIKFPRNKSSNGNDQIINAA